MQIHPVLIIKGMWPPDISIVHLYGLWIQHFLNQTSSFETVYEA